MQPKRSLKQYPAGVPADVRTDLVPSLVSLEDRRPRHAGRARLLPHVDRKKDMILVSGFNVYPNDGEDIFTRMRRVLECAAIGMSDAKAGEAVRLVVVRTDSHGSSPSEAELRACCAAHLTGYKRPKVVEFRSALPKPAVGNVLRRELRDNP